MLRFVIVCVAVATAAALSRADDPKTDPKSEPKTPPKVERKAEPARDMKIDPPTSPKTDPKVAIRDVKDAIDDFTTMWTNKDSKKPEDLAKGLAFYLVGSGTNSASSTNSFTWVTASGDVFGQNDWIQKALEGKLAVTGYTADEIKEIAVTYSSVWVSETGASAAVVETWWVDRAGNQPGAVRVRFTATCTKERNGWKLVSVQVASPKK